MDDYIYFSIDGRDLKIHKENPDDIFMLRTHHNKGKMKNPKWNQLKIQTNEKGYKLIYVAKKNYRLHRVNYFAWNQDWNIHDNSKKNEIDHIKSTDKLDKHQNNNIENLRVVTHQQNLFNTNRKGYYWCKQNQKWHTRIQVNGKQKHLGYFLLEDEARQAYLEAKKIYHKIK
jgi:hypothetical protein